MSFVIAAYEDYAKQINSIFNVSQNEEEPSVELVLEECVVKISTSQQECFSLFFSGQAHALLPQGTYLFKHDQLGDNFLFMVPISQSEQVAQYEVIINRFINTN